MRHPTAPHPRIAPSFQTGIKTVSHSKRPALPIPKGGRRGVNHRTLSACGCISALVSGDVSQCSLHSKAPDLASHSISSAQNDSDFLHFQLLIAVPPFMRLNRNPRDLQAGAFVASLFALPAGEWKGKWPCRAPAHGWRSWKRRGNWELTAVRISTIIARRGAKRRNLISIG